MKLRDIEVIYEDGDILVANKPSGLLSVPDRYDRDLPSLSEMLQDRHSGLLVVHRLDRGTSGAIVFAKNPATHTDLNRQFEERTAKKHYWLLALGTTPESGEITANIAPHPSGSKMMAVPKRGKTAQTNYKTLRHYRQFSLVEAMPLTGRTHQIRVHFFHIGHEIIADPVYGRHGPLYLSTFKRNYRSSKDGNERPLMNRLALHARELSLTHPTSGKTMHWEAPLHKDFAATIKQLDKWAK